MLTLFAVTGEENETPENYMSKHTEIALQGSRVAIGWVGGNRCRCAYFRSGGAKTLHQEGQVDHGAKTLGHLRLAKTDPASKRWPTSRVLTLRSAN